MMMPLVLLLQLSLVVGITHSQRYRGSDLYKEAALTAEDFASFANGSYLSHIPDDLKSYNARHIPLDTDDQGHHFGDNGSEAHRTRRGAYGGVWQEGVVPYVISDAYWQWQIGMIWRAMKEIEDASCIVFKLRTGEPDYIFIGPINGCKTKVGKRGGKHDVSLVYECFYHNTIMHELMHALGFQHEHQRWDRDDYVDIFWYNIRSDLQYNYNRVTGDDYDIPYDYDSILHYDSWAADKLDWGLFTTMLRKDGSNIYKAQHLSEKDAEKLNRRHKCKTGTPVPKTP